MCLTGTKADIANQRAGFPYRKRAGESEIDQLYVVAARLDHEILGLQIAVQVTMIMHHTQSLYRLIDNEGNRLQGELALTPQKQILQIEVKFLDNNVRILGQFAEGVDLRKVLGVHELEHDLKLTLDQDYLLSGEDVTLPWFFSILQA